MGNESLTIETTKGIEKNLDLEGEKSIFGSSLFSGVLDDLIDGAKSELESEGTGWILSILGAGGNGDDNELQKMDQELQNVLTKLDQIISELKKLAKQLNLDKVEIETYIEGAGAQTAIAKIKTHFDGVTPSDLNHYSNKTISDRGDTLNRDISTFVSHALGGWDIETSLTKIHTSIFPDIGNTNGLLELWTETFILKGNNNSYSLLNYYKSLEKYFSILLMYQFKGLNILVEALNYNQKLDTKLETKKFQSDAYEYISKTFKPRIKQQTDEFYNMVTKLITSFCDLTSKKNFLPEYSEEILKRASFFITQVLGEKEFGIFVDVLGTGNLMNDFQKTVISQGKKEFYKPEIVSKITNTKYDAWGTCQDLDFTTLKKDDEYVLNRSIIKNPESDSFNAWLIEGPSKRLIPIGSAKVTTYTPDYKEDPKGEIKFGYILGDYRRGGREMMMNDDLFKVHFYRNDHSDDVEWWHDDKIYPHHLYLKVKANNKYTNTSTNTDMKVERYRKFKIDGADTLNCYLNIDAQLIDGDDDNAFVYKHIENDSADCEIGYHLGIYDDTKKQVVKRIDRSLSPSDLNKHIKFDKKYRHIHETLHLHKGDSLVKGRDYYVYANVYGNGSNYSGDYKFQMPLKVYHLSITFEKTDF